MAVVFVSMVGSVPNSATGIELWLPPKVTKATVAVLAPVTCRFICSGTCRKLGLAQYDATCSHGQAAAISLAMFQVYIILKATTHRRGDPVGLCAEAPRASEAGGLMFVVEG